MSEIRTDTPPPAAVLRLFVGLAIVFLPLNALPYFRDVLGEMAYEAAFYPLAIGIIWWAATLAGGLKMEFPRHHSARLLIVFVVWVFISGLMNAPGVVEAVIKGRTGIEKFVLQSVLVLFVLVSSIFIYNAFVPSRAMLYQVRTWMLVSFIVCGTYSLLEIGTLLGLPSFGNALAFVDQFIRDPDNLRAYTDFGRLRSVSGEASWFAMYCALVTPWILSYLFTDQKLRWWYLPVVMYLLMLIVLTWSRAAYVITVLQLAIFMIGASFLLRDGAMRVRGRATTLMVVFAFAGTAALTVVIFDEQVFMQRSLMDIFVSLLDTDNLSNVGRAGSQMAAMKIAFDHPWFGVGFGQYGFHMPSYMPSWALGSTEVADWMSSSPDTPWAPVHGIYSRIAAELGLAGLIIWIAIWGSVIHALCVRLRRISDSAKGEQMLGLALLTSIVGVLLCGFNADSLRFFGYWITLAVAWAYLDHGARAEPQQRTP